ncbi:Flp pilus assembly protein CpaB [uncultured Pseudacidovorax sp.]|uniref:Flp pilus assembly protein CpaB n=1 Tax=uncultured Pseudacidovorax sp. TaxID=679313 RepID=UPI0025EA9EEF|nr:Flp pilus assembly protein CpaB [uncultured Pseudacidovorax sp.]
MLRFSKILAVLLVLLAVALAVYAWLLSRNPAPTRPAAAPVASVPTAAPAATYAVVVTTKTVPAGQPIPADALQLAQLPINPAGAFRSPADVAGRVPVLDLGEGTPVLEAQLSTGLALKLADGERAVAVKVDEVIGVGNRVTPGDYVDVFFTLKADGRDIERSQARLLMARLRVLAFGQASVDGNASRAEGSNGRVSTVPAGGQRAEAARTAVLAVPVADVNRLVLGETTGRLLLALRNPADAAEPDPRLFAELPPALQPLPATRGDKVRAPLEGIDRAQAGLAVEDLANGGARTARRPVAAAPSRAADRPAPSGLEVEVIRGDRRETVRY